MQASSYVGTEAASPSNPKLMVHLIFNPNTRENALSELSRFRETIPDLAILLWTTPGIMAVLLQELIAVFPLLSPPTLSSPASTRVCNVLALMQCIASHPETRRQFLEAQIPNFLYPCLNASSKARPFEYLRLTCLGVIGALVKNDSPEVIEYLMSTEIVPLCLQIMESGNELSRTVAIFILQKILLDDQGLDHICQTYERFFAVTTVLNTLTMELVESRSLRLIKHVIRCYLRLTDNKKALEGLRQILPDPLKSGLFRDLVQEDPATAKYYKDLLSILN